MDQDIVYSLDFDEIPQTLNCILIPHGDKVYMRVLHLLANQLYDF